VVDHHHVTPSIVLAIPESRPRRRRRRRRRRMSHLAAIILILTVILIVIAILTAHVSIFPIPITLIVIFIFIVVGSHPRICEALRVSPVANRDVHRAALVVSFVLPDGITALVGMNVSRKHGSNPVLVKQRLHGLFHR
jgi:hypothetical protein